MATTNNGLDHFASGELIPFAGASNLGIDHFASGELLAVAQRAGGVALRGSGGVKLGGSAQATTAAGVFGQGGFDRYVAGELYAYAGASTLGLDHFAAGELVRGAYGGPAFNIVSLAGSGGLKLGGSAPLAVVRALAPSGGLALGGSAAMGRRAALLPSGGLTLGGSGLAEAVAPGVLFGAGGLSLGGSARLTTALAVLASSGGLTLGGSATVARLVTLDAAGGVDFGASFNPLVRLLWPVRSTSTPLGPNRSATRPAGLAPKLSQSRRIL